ncbi:Parvovirus coat protein VP1-like protein [Lysinibacillus yapensis]|uniref:Parvovirus coat protein VP1-like protein n=1 Tax=Ureibacillus yapensis TaxID=2304605 RepID=A0A396S506_9BACL|nr:Parvovirus coat protein VP1-like protein [Lysinibacillus yapensis]RHW33390.1 Parvovirus coat protein VP1-like protein [Lysinibacillus yapensis]
MRHRRIGYCAPGYRYCGPGCSGPGSPTNQVDACCKAHDECYFYNKDKSYRRYCDNLFYQCLAPYTNHPNKIGRDARLFTRIIQLKNYLIG